MAEAEAVEAVSAVDAERAAFVKRYFNVEWPARERYHLMINTDRGEEGAIQNILNGMALLDKPHALEAHR